jgi:hypothetical protein
VALDDFDTPLEAAANRHRGILEGRGYVAVEQLHLDGFLLRNSPWKTYWKLEDQTGAAFFCKVNYGQQKSEINVVLGRKEAMLALHIEKALANTAGLLVPHITAHWEAEGCYFVVMEWVATRKLSLQSSLSDVKLFELLRLLLSSWGGLGRPEWWQAAYEQHDFACKRRYPLREGDRALFSFDLTDNIGLTGRNQLYFHDFEFVQIVPRGLQEVYVALSVLFGSSRHFASWFRGDNEARRILNELSRERVRAVLPQAREALWQRLVRGGDQSPLKRLKLRCCAALVRADLGRLGKRDTVLAS